MLQAEDGIRDQPRSRGLGDVYKSQREESEAPECGVRIFPVNGGELVENFLLGGSEVHLAKFSSVRFGDIDQKHIFLVDLSTDGDAVDGNGDFSSFHRLLHRIVNRANRFDPTDSLAILQHAPGP